MAGGVNVVRLHDSGIQDRGLRYWASRTDKQQVGRIFRCDVVLLRLRYRPGRTVPAQTWCVVKHTCELAVRACLALVWGLPHRASGKSAAECTLTSTHCLAGSAPLPMMRYGSGNGRLYALCRHQSISPPPLTPCPALPRLLPWPQAAAEPTLQRITQETGYEMRPEVRGVGWGNCHGVVGVGVDARHNQ